MNSETKPSRKILATRKSSPVAIAVADASAAYFAGSPAAIGATSAASMAAEPDVQDTARCRDEPNSAYAARPATAE